MSAKKAAAKKKAPAGKKKLAKKAPRGRARSSKAKLKPAHKPSTQSREVSQAHERQEGLDQAGRSQGSTQTIREEDDRYRTEEAGPRPAGARSRGVETRSAARRPETA